MIKITLILSLFAIVYNSAAQDFEEFYKIVASDRETEDRFGWSVDIDGDFAIVGAYADDFGDANPNMGSAYIFQKVGLDWIEVQKIYSSDQDDYDRFGWSVAIDGDYAIVGAYAEDHNVDGGGLLSRAGSAYIFERGEDGIWIQVQKIVAGDRAADDEFGWSVDIDGTTAIVGAHIDDKNALGLGSFYHAGSAYIFDRSVDGVWTQTQKIVAPDRSGGTVYAADHEDWNDRFGYDVAIWNNYIAVTGAFTDRAYAFEKTGGTWTCVSYLIYPGHSWIDRAGAISIDSTTILLGAQTEDSNPDGMESILNSGGAAVFKRTGIETWSFAQKLSPADRDAGDHFGISVSVNGPYLAIGTHSDNHDEFGEDEIENTGSVYLFEIQDDGTYLEIKKLDASDRAMDDELGISVSLSGNTLLTGAFQQDLNPDGGDYILDAGAAYFYTNDPSDPGYCDSISITQDITICNGDSYLIGDSTYTIAGDYTNILIAINGCDSIVYTSLSVALPEFHSQEITICSGESLIVGESEYFASGEYEDLLESVFGCDSTVYTSLTVASPVTFTQEITICSGDFITVGEVAYFTSGDYIDNLISDLGCDSIVYTYLTVLDPIILDVAQVGANLESLQEGASYQWIKCDPFDIIIGANEKSYEVTENGEYAVIIDNGVCTDTSDCISLTSVGLNNINLDLIYSVYPNPTNSKVVITNASNQEGIVRIYNIMGEIIMENKLDNSAIELDFSNASAGMYLLKIITNSGIYTENIIFKPY